MQISTKTSCKLTVKSPNTRIPLFLEKMYSLSDSCTYHAFTNSRFNSQTNSVFSHFRKREKAAADTSEMFHLVKVQNLYS